MAKRKEFANPAESLGLADGSLDGNALFKEDLPGPIKVNTADVWMNKKIDPKKQKGKTLELSAEEDTLMGRLAKRMASRDLIDNLDLGMGTKEAKEVSDNGLMEFPRRLNISGAIKKGRKIEREHDSSVEKINPKFDKKKAAELIAKDHLKEHKDYYDEKKGLPAMERNLEKADNTIQAPKGMGLFKHMEDKKATNFSDPIPEKMLLEGNNMAQQARKSGRVVGHKGWNIVGDPY